MLRLGVGVDAVAGADASLQRARGGVSWAHRGPGDREGESAT
jgi:hypothetical protein